MKSAFERQPSSVDLLRLEAVLLVLSVLALLVVFEALEAEVLVAVQLVPRQVAAWEQGLSHHCQPGFQLLLVALLSSVVLVSFCEVVVRAVIVVPIEHCSSMVSAVRVDHL